MGTQPFSAVDMAFLLLKVMGVGVVVVVARRMEDGRWKMENGKWKIEDDSPPAGTLRMMLA